MPELNRWLQIVVMEDSVRLHLYLLCGRQPTRYVPSSNSD